MLSNAPAQLDAVPDIFPRLIDRARLNGELLHRRSVQLARRLCNRCRRRWPSIFTRRGSQPTATTSFSMRSISITASRMDDARDPMGAISAFRESIRLKPDFSPPYINLGRSLEDIGQAGSAGQPEWMTLIGKVNVYAVNGEALAHKLTAMHQAARVLKISPRQRCRGRRNCCGEMLNLDPPSRRSGATLDLAASAASQMAEFLAFLGRNGSAQRDLVAGVSMCWSLANFTDDPMFQLAKSYRYAKQAIGMPKATPRRRPARRSELRPVLRIGYAVSSDLQRSCGRVRNDRRHRAARPQEFRDILAYYCGIVDPDVTQERIKSSVDQLDRYQRVG